MLPLGFRFDVEAIISGGVAHSVECELLPVDLPTDSVRVQPGGAYHSERCPRVCPRCEPPFETLLSYQLPPEVVRGERLVGR